MATLEKATSLVGWAWGKPSLTVPIFTIYLFKPSPIFVFTEVDFCFQEETCLSPSPSSHSADFFVVVRPITFYFNLTEAKHWKY